MQNWILMGGRGPSDMLLCDCLGSMGNYITSNRLNLNADWRKNPQNICNVNGILEYRFTCPSVGPCPSCHSTGYEMFEKVWGKSFGQCILHDSSGGVEASFVGLGTVKYDSDNCNAALSFSSINCLKVLDGDCSVRK